QAADRSPPPGRPRRPRRRAHPAPPDTGLPRPPARGRRPRPGGRLSDPPAGRARAAAAGRRGATAAPTPVRRPPPARHGRGGASWSPSVPEKMHGMTDTTSLGRARLDRIAVSAMDNNVYLLTAPSGEQLLIDAADDSDAILTLLGGAGPLRTVVTTHGHWDHHRALPTVVAATHARTAAGAPDAPDLPVRVDDLLAHGDRISVDSAGEVVLDVIALRGHTAGSIALAVTEDETAPHPGRVHLFTGD